MENFSKYGQEAVSTFIQEAFKYDFSKESEEKIELFFLKWKCLLIFISENMSSIVATKLLTYFKEIKIKVYQSPNFDKSKVDIYYNEIRKILDPITFRDQNTVHKNQIEELKEIGKNLPPHDDSI